MDEKTKQSTIYDNMEGLSPIIERWSRINANMGEISEVNFRFFPYMVWHDKTSYKHSELLEKLADYFVDKKIIDFCGAVRYVQLRFPFHQYYQSRDVLNNTLRLVAKLSNTSLFEVGRQEKESIIRVPCAPIEDIQAYEENPLKHETDQLSAELRLEYKGIVYFDVTEWIDNFRNAAFTAFLQCIEENAESLFVVFCVVGESADKVKELAQYISTYQRVEFVDLLSYSKERMHDYSLRFFEQHGIKPTKEVIEELKITVGELFDHGYIIDYQSMDKLCQDVIYEWLFNKKADSSIMELDDIMIFRRDGKYIKERILEAKMHRMIKQ